VKGREGQVHRGNREGRREQRKNGKERTKELKTSTDAEVADEKKA